MKIWRKRLTYLLTELINDEAVYRTAPATPGLLNIEMLISRLNHMIFTHFFQENTQMSPIWLMHSSGHIWGNPTRLQPQTENCVDNVGM